MDTHGNQLASQDPQLVTPSRALAAFRDDLVARGIEGRVMTVVFSEFGRRVASNNTGTDHGAGGLMMAMGSSVRGGMRGAFPGLSQLYNGDLRVTTDFRAVYSSVISEWLGGDPGAVIPGGPFPSGGRSSGERAGAHRGRPHRRLPPGGRDGRRGAAHPPPEASPPPPLPTSLAVDEDEWTVIPSKRVVAAGPVTLRVYNRGMDDHDVSLVDATGTLHRVALAPGASTEVRATLTPGTWKIWCSLFEGTPSLTSSSGWSRRSRRARIRRASAARPAGTR